MLANGRLDAARPRAALRLIEWLAAGGGGGGDGPAAALRRWIRGPVRFRYETFGGILSTEHPPVLAYVDKDFVRRLGRAESPLWDGPEAGVLSAPTEVHYSLTGRCSNGCAHCYVDAGPQGSGPTGGRSPELDTAGAKRLVEVLARMGVFHLALGGGEAALREDLVEIARHARALGIVPNLTTSGAGVDERFATRAARVFGRIHVSVDGVGALYGAAGRLAPGFDAADRTIRLLGRAGAHIGINCVLTREGFDGLDDLARYARRVGVREIEFLRFKAAGRALSSWAEKRLTAEQARRLFPAIVDLAGRHGLLPRLDCSLVPMIAWHGPPPERLDRLGVTGCEAGNVLAGIRPGGELAACSYAVGCGEDAAAIERLWVDSAGLERFRRWIDRSPPPCASCRYLEVCKGGCHVVAEAVTGDFHAPDPECPFVVAGTTGA